MMIVNMLSVNEDRMSKVTPSIGLNLEIDAKDALTSDIYIEAALNEDVSLYMSKAELDETIKKLIELQRRIESKCPGCGCEPGDGYTIGCNHEQGCGHYKKAQ